MCLIKLHKEIKTADYDIPVYKVLTSDNCAPYIENYHYTHGLNSPMELPPPDHSTCPIIESGFLHAYASEFWAVYKMTELETRFIPRRHLKVVKMYIPKNSGYYEGTDGDICAQWLYWPKEDTAQPGKE